MHNFCARFFKSLWLNLQMVLFVLVLYFLVRGVLGFLKQGYKYLLSTWRVMGVCKLTLALSVCGLHLSRCIMAEQQWTSYLVLPQDTFTDFSPLARQSQLFTVMAALLLFILVLKVRPTGRRVKSPEGTFFINFTFHLCPCSPGIPPAAVSPGVGRVRQSFAALRLGASGPRPGFAVDVVGLRSHRAPGNRCCVMSLYYQATFLPLTKIVKSLSTHIYTFIQRLLSSRISSALQNYSILQCQATVCSC